MPRIVVLYGGTSNEREVSLMSGGEVYKHLEGRYDVALIDVTEDALPEGIDAERDLIFPVFHGAFGEDGGFQALLEAGGYAFVGCGAESSRLCMEKEAVKAKLRKVGGVRMARGVSFSAQEVSRVGVSKTHLQMQMLGPSSPRLRRGSVTPMESLRGVFPDVSKWVLKPTNYGSGLGVEYIEGWEALEERLGEERRGDWMLEECIKGYDTTVGVLHGEALGIVDIHPYSGVNDYDAKYVKGLTEFVYPSPMEEGLAAEVRRVAELVYKECGCRDFARVDFMVTEAGEAVFLEINTIPGLTSNSLLPMSASCSGLSFEAMLDEILRVGVERFKQRRGEL